MGADSDCVFCRIISGELPSTKIYEDSLVAAFRDIRPATPVHVLIVPREHVAGLSDCGPEHRELLGHLLLAAGKVAELEKITSYRLLINNGREAGQTVFHLHAHVLGGRNLGDRLL